MYVYHAYITADKKEIEFYDIVFNEITKIAVELGLSSSMIGNNMQDLDVVEKTWWLLTPDTKITGEATRIINILLRSSPGSAPFITVEEFKLTKHENRSIPWKLTSIQLADPELFNKIRFILLNKIPHSISE